MSDQQPAESAPALKKRSKRFAPKRPQSRVAPPVAVKQEGEGGGRGKGGGRLRRNDGRGRGRGRGEGRGRGRGEPAPQGAAFFEPTAAPGKGSSGAGGGGGGGGASSGAASGVAGGVAAIAKWEEDTNFLDGSSGDDEDAMDVDGGDDPLRPTAVAGLEDTGAPPPPQPSTFGEERERARSERLFAVDAADDDEDELLVIQLPTSLPASLPRRAKVKAEDAGEGDEAQPAEGSYDELASLRPGKIGKLQIMRSGEVRLVLGDEVLDVDRGVQAQMYQQIVTVDADADELAVLGDVGKKLLCTVRADGVDSDGDGGDAAMKDDP